MSGKPDLFAYIDYRLYLKDLYAHLKATTRHFSYRYFSEKAGFQSPNYLKLVMEGKRNLTTESEAQFAKALKFSKEELRHFKNIVGYAQAQDQEEKTQFAEKILQSQKYQKFHPLAAIQYEFYRSWLHVAVRELAHQADFQADPEWISARLAFAMPQEEIVASIKLLLELGLLSEVDHRLVPAHATVTTQGEMVKTAVIGFHKEMMELATRSLTETPRDQREISAVTVAVSEQRFAEIKEMIHEMRKKILAMATEDLDPERVVQINFQVFPLSKAIKTDR